MQWTVFILITYQYFGNENMFDIIQATADICLFLKQQIKLWFEFTQCPG